MSVQLDIESQCEEVVVSDEGSTIAAKKDKWRSVRVILQAGNAFASANRIRLLNHDEQPLLNDRVGSNGNVQLTNISTSIQVSSHLELNGDGENHVRNKEQQYANIALIVKNKDMDSLNQFGGVKAFAEALGSDLENGLPSPVDQSYKLQAPDNEFLSMLKNACDKKILFLILLCGILLLALGIIEEGWKTGWYQGALIICAIVFIVAASLIRGYWSLCFPKNQSSVREVLVDVLRGGTESKISNSKVALGDIVCLSTGNEVPADGLFVRGESLKLDEESQSTISDQYPFMFCGANVIHGTGRMLVTSVGKDTVLGALMSEVTPTKKGSLQLQLDSFNAWMQYVALLINICLIIVIFLRFMCENKQHRPGSPDLKAKPAEMNEIAGAIVKIITSTGKMRTLTTLLTMILLGFSEGMSVTVTLAIVYWNKKATSNKASTQEIEDCLTAGSVTTTCTDIHAELTLTHEELDIYIGTELITEVSNIDPNVHQLLCDGIETLQRPMSMMEDALLTWATIKPGLEISTVKGQYSITELKEQVLNEVPGVSMRKRKVNNYSGPAMEILSMCSHYHDNTGEIKAFNGMEKREVIQNLQAEYLQSIALAYEQVNTSEETNLILVGTVHLKPSLRRSMKALKDAGVTIILASKHSVADVKTTALLWGLIAPNMDLEHSVILGDQFRSLTHDQRIQRVDHLNILANALPFDKLLLVKCLKEKAHTVAMVGMSSHDIPAMAEADLGITMGECSIQLVKDSSKIVISQGNFSTFLNIVEFGRTSCENIQKFTRIELTMAIAWWLISIISTICFGDSPISTIQYFWIGLIEPFLGGLAILTVSPNDVIMRNSPERGIVPRTTWRIIVLEALYQTAILVTFQYKATTVLGINQKVARTMIFNSFVLCQVFNWFNARKIKKNLLSEITHNFQFWVAIGVAVVLQEIHTEIANIVVNNARLNVKQWAICFLIAGPACVIDLLHGCISYLVAGWLPNQNYRITESPSSSGSLPSLGLPLIEDVPQEG